MAINHKLILCIIFFTLTACSQSKQPLAKKLEIRIPIIAIVNGIADDNELKSEEVGYGAARTEQWERFEKLKSEATDEELIALTDHQNAVVRCYAFQALVSRKKADMFSILLQHLNDTAKVLTLDGCEGSEMSVTDCFLEYLSPYNVTRDSSLLTPAQKASVDSILIFNTTRKIDAKYHLLNEIKPNKHYYARIKEIAQKENRPEAIVALARFNNKNDIPLIKTLCNNEESVYYATYAIREFPDSSFYSFLCSSFEKKYAEKFYDNSGLRILFQALARFPLKNTYELFAKATLTKDPIKKQLMCKYILIAITKYPNALFEPLKLKIKPDDFSLTELKREMSYEK